MGDVELSESALQNLFQSKYMYIEMFHMHLLSIYTNCHISLLNNKRLTFEALKWAYDSIKVFLSAA